MAVDFPAGAGQLVTVLRGPVADCLMCLVEEGVGAEVRRGDHRAGRCGRTDDLAVAVEGGFELDADFQVDLLVPVERDVPARTRELLRADDAPHEAAGLWDDPGEFLNTRPTTHDGERTTVELFK